LLDLAGKRYTGSGMVASAVSMNKAIAKRLFGSIGVRTPEWKLYDTSAYKSTKALAEKIALEHSFPLIVKPNAGGSTVGLSKVNSADDLPGALEQAMKEDRKILVERYVPGRELTVAVLDHHAFPVVEIRPKNELYDYEAKYTKGKSEYIAPAEIPEDISEAVKTDAVRVFDVVGASGLARVDFLWSEPREHYCLEINTLPGMTSLSLAPMAAACEGIDFDRLLEMIIESALRP
ncbi:MAG: D-alanine--D-alanine ligase, partial [Candidatus Zixiibacteriota bacterium]